jgi:hypothetical protein
MNAPEAVPSYIHYNAYRWLRDSGFEPGTFISSNATVVAEPDITAGLLRYSQWRSKYPGRDGLGVLAFGTTRSTASDFDMRPVIFTPWVVIGVHCFMAVCVIGGAVLVWRFAKRTPYANRVEPCAAPE